MDLSYDMNEFSKFNPGIVSIDVKPSGMIVGTKGSEIYEFTKKKPTLLL